jgi:hypothetical protein
VCGGGGGGGGEYVTVFCVCVRVCVFVCVHVCVFFQNPSAINFCSEHVSSYHLQHEAECKVHKIEERTRRSEF